MKWLRTLLMIILSIVFGVTGIRMGTPSDPDPSLPPTREDTTAMPSTEAPSVQIPSFYGREDVDDFVKHLEDAGITVEKRNVMSRDFTEGKICWLSREDGISGVAEGSSVPAGTKLILFVSAGLIVETTPAPTAPAPTAPAETYPYVPIGRNWPGYYTREAAGAFIPDLEQARNLIRSVPGGKYLQTFGAVKPSDEAIAKVQAAINDLTWDGHQLGFIMIDLNTLSGAAYNCEAPFWCHSTIKAIYVTSLVENVPQALTYNDDKIMRTIVNSSNADYEEMRENIYGSYVMNWVKELGVPESMGRRWYPPDRSAKDMLLMWTKAYAVLNGTGPIGNLLDYFSRSVASAAMEQFKGRFTVHTKAGWENGMDESVNYVPGSQPEPRMQDGDPTNGEAGTNDAGVVYSDKGPYLFVIYSNQMYGRFPNYTMPNRLLGLTEALYQLQCDLAARK